MDSLSGVQSAVFTGSFPRYEDCPPGGRPEYAFIGRSNVGKSSLINALTSQKKLAKTSGTPGKTQLINYFLINHIAGKKSAHTGWYLVDLPGYGYAKVSKTSRQKWERMIRKYLVMRESLTAVFVLIDARIAPQPMDLAFIEWLGEQQVPFVLVFTKADKQKPVETEEKVAAFLQAMKENWETLPPHFITSAVKGTGCEDLLGYVNAVNKGL